jgi:hypothetical protein
VDPAVAPPRVVLRQPDDESSSSLGDGRPARTAVWVGPALGDEVTVPAQQGCWLHEDASETMAREQSCQPGEQRSVGGLQ